MRCCFGGEQQTSSPQSPVTTPNPLSAAPPAQGAQAPAAAPAGSKQTQQATVPAVSLTPAKIVEEKALAAISPTVAASENSQSSIVPPWHSRQSAAGVGMETTTPSKSMTAGGVTNLAEVLRLNLGEVRRL